MLKNNLRFLFCLVLLLSCSLKNSNQKGLVLFEAALMSGTATNNDFTKAKDYLYACIYSESGAGEAWGSLLQDVGFTYSPSSPSTPVGMSFSVEIPALWVGRVYNFTVFGYKNKQPSNFICSKNPPSGVAWARLGRGAFEIKPKPEPIAIPFGDFYENLPTFVAPKISINNGDAVTNVLDVKLSLEAAAATEVYLSNSACNYGGNWQLFQPEVPWVLVGNNPKVYAKFKNGDGYETSCVSDSILIDVTPPTVAIQINGGAATTSSNSVDLSFTGSETLSQQYITNAPDCTGGGIWEPFSGTKPWSLGSFGTNVSVYAQFKDLAGNTSSCVSDSIDYTAPSGIPTGTGISIAGGAAFTSNAQVTLALSASGATNVYVTNDPTCLAGGNWTPMSGSTLTLNNWPLNQLNAVATVYAKFKNSAGESGCVSDSITHDNLAPVITPVSLEPGSALGQVKARFSLSETPYTIGLYDDSACIGAVLTSNLLVSPSTFPGEVTIESTNLAGSNNYIAVKVEDPSGKSTCQSLGPFFSCLHAKCGYAGVPSCYDPTFVANHSSACLKNGVQIDYVFANGTSGFKVWKESGMNHFLRASGLWEGPNDWQKTLDRKGRGFTTALLADSSNIEGRVSPTHVFLNDGNKTATGQWLYYTKDMGLQTLKVSSGKVGEDKLTNWDNIASGGGSAPSWYEGNIKTCADLGMRLPTLYESEASKPSNYLPKDWVPQFGGTRVPKAGGTDDGTWTATASTYESLTKTTHFTWGYNGQTNSTNYWYWETPARVRCVLPGN